MPHSYRPNIAKYLIFSALRGASTATSIVLWVVFLQQYYGFSLTQVTLLDLPFWIGKFIFEIPTGVVADRFGRRPSLAIGAVLNSLIWLVFAVSNSFLMMAIAQFFGAFAATFSSGADEALLFETMQALGREGEYAKISGRARAVETISAMVVGLGVGVLASIHLLLPVLLTSLLWALTLLPILTMKETGGAQVSQPPARDAQTENDPPKWYGYAQIVRQAVSALRAQAALRWAAAYLVVLGSVSFYAATFLQPYALTLGLSIPMLGPVLVIVQVMSIAGSLAVPRVQARLGSRAILFGAPLLLVPCLLLAGLLRAAPVLVIIALASFLFSLTQPVLLAVIQRRVSNTARATLLSIQSLLFTIFLTLTEPPLGILADRYGVHTAYLVMAALIVAFCFPLLRRTHPPRPSFPGGKEGAFWGW